MRISGFLATAAFIKVSLLGLHPVQDCLKQEGIGIIGEGDKLRG
jgi:hypothetical protein